MAFGALSPAQLPTEDSVLECWPRIGSLSLCRTNCCDDPQFHFMQCLIDSLRSSGSYLVICEETAMQHCAETKTKTLSALVSEGPEKRRHRPDANGASGKSACDRRKCSVHLWRQVCFLFVMDNLQATCLFANVGPRNILLALQQ